MSCPICHESILFTNSGTIPLIIGFCTRELHYLYSQDTRFKNEWIDGVMYASHLIDNGPAISYAACQMSIQELARNFRLNYPSFYPYFRERFNRHFPSII